MPGVGLPRSGDAANTSQAYRILLTPPQWLLGRAWDIQVSMACSGWTTFFRQYAVLPRDSLVFNTLRNEPREKLLDLFEKGLASPFSMDEEGWTLLHVGD